MHLFLKHEFELSDNAIDLGIKQSQLESAPLPVILLSFGLITLEQFQTLLDWIEKNHKYEPYN
ncbi:MULTISPECIES: DUF2949 domain-containing protein [Prochlorococcus]|nr:MULTISPECIES: DUF2949 domain-containing protein [Prochlorococcus]KGG11704.1 hypothetical protein EV04_0728 [Prochlorococcus marinus str. LG]KGG35124.1 hypothetical protein EV11_1526 [Prochlorococcus sp. SS52]